MSSNRRAWEYMNCLLVWDGEQQGYGANVNGREVRGIRAALNLYGQNGWELVAFTPEEWHAPHALERPEACPQVGRVLQYRALLKRPL